MKEYIQVTLTNDIIITIFTQSICYIKPKETGCAIHLNVGGERLALVVKPTMEEVLEMIKS